MLNKEKIIYIDGEQPYLQNVAASFCIVEDSGEPMKIIYTGKSVSSMSVTDKKEKAYQVLANEYDVNFIFGDIIPQIVFYPVPQLQIFAVDSFNGCFCSVNTAVDISEEDAPIYYIDEKLNCYYLASNLHEFLSIVVFCPEWKEKLALGSSVNYPFSPSGREYLIDLLHLQAEVSVAKLKRTEDTIIIFPSIEEAKKKIDFYNIQKEIDKLNNSTCQE